MAKKDFKINNPALNFITTQQEPTKYIQEEKKVESIAPQNKKAPDGYKFNPEYIEVKSKRVQLLLQPSVVEDIKLLAKQKGLSMNEAINEAIQNYLKEEKNKEV